MNESLKCEETRDRGQYQMFHSQHFKEFTGIPGLDIGYKGGNHASGHGSPIFGYAGIDLDSPKYDGIHLPFADHTFATVHSSHVLEHIKDWKTAIKEWFRVLRIEGYLIIKVPHQYLYEKKSDLPSHFNKEHVRFYTPGDLLAEIEMSLEPNHYRLIYCRDNDTDFDYNIPPKRHSTGMYEIECVIKRIMPPTWALL